MLNCMHNLYDTDNASLAEKINSLAIKKQKFYAKRNNLHIHLDARSVYSLVSPSLLPLYLICMDIATVTKILVTQFSFFFLLLVTLKCVQYS